MFRKIKNRFDYIWRILHHFFIEKYWDPNDLSAALGGAEKKFLDFADWVAETEKGKNVV